MLKKNIALLMYWIIC